MKSNEKNNILTELKWREMLKDVANSDNLLQAQNNKLGVYCGFDPTADSLHIGNLIQLLALKRFAKYGFKPFVIIGGATAIIGDPSGKKDERQLKSYEEINNNINNIKSQIKKIIPEATIVNNNSWLKDINLITFLHDIGKKFNVSYLINKEHIRSRIETGISYTEFTYTLLQAYDFYYLYNNYNVSVQIGGSDQWGNITSGIEYIKNNVDICKASGLTINLLLKVDGTKFGKTESGTIWLSKEKTSPYLLYQFFINQDDKFALKLLKYFTFYTLNEILDIEKKHLLNPQNRYIQKELAKVLVIMLHSQKDLDIVLQLSEALFNNEIKKVSKDNLKMLNGGIPTNIIQIDQKLSDVLITTKIFSSKREIREFIKSRAIIINDEVITDENLVLNHHNALHLKYFILRKGKKNYYLLVLQNK